MDKKAKKILFNTYWKNGWRDEYTVESEEAFLYAKEKGYMFDNISIHHDDLIEEIINFRERTDINRLLKAFLSSLSSRRLDLRLALASWKMASYLNSHDYHPVQSGEFYENGVIVSKSYTCGICRECKYGVIGDETYNNTDLNVLNFERLKWGGVRHGDLMYTYLDLKLFNELLIPDVTETDIRIFLDTLNVINTSEDLDYPGTLSARLKDVSNLKSSKNERDMLVEIMACIGLLKPKSYDRPLRGKGDWVYAEFWRGEDKVDEETLKTLFYEYL